MTEWECKAINQDGQTTVYFLRYNTSRILLNYTFTCTPDNESNNKVIGSNNCSGETISPSVLCLLLKLHCENTKTNTTANPAITVNRKNAKNMFLIPVISYNTKPILFYNSLDIATAISLVLLAAVSAGWLGTFIWQRITIRKL